MRLSVLSLYRAVVTSVLFLVRMAILGVMTLLQLTFGGVDIRPASQAAAAATSA
jgi:hypothetical protein